MSDYDGDNDPADSYDDGSADPYEAAINAVCFEASEHYDERDEYDHYDERGIWFGKDGEPILEGDEIPTITVDDWREDETIEERNARLLAQAAEQRDRDRPRKMLWEHRDPEETAAQALPIPRVARHSLRGKIGQVLNTTVREQLPPKEMAAVKIIRPGGEEHWTALGNDQRAIKAFVSQRAEAAGYDFAELVKPFAPVRHQPESEQQRRNVLARVVLEARERGAKIKALSLVLKRPLSTINTLENRGRVLRGLAA